MVSIKGDILIFSEIYRNHMPPQEAHFRPGSVCGCPLWFITPEHSNRSIVLEHQVLMQQNVSIGTLIPLVSSAIFSPSKNKLPNGLPPPCAQHLQMRGVEKDGKPAHRDRSYGQRFSECL